MSDGPRMVHSGTTEVHSNNRGVFGINGNGNEKNQKNCC